MAPIVRVHRCVDSLTAHHQQQIAGVPKVRAVVYVVTFCATSVVFGVLGLVLLASGHIRDAGGVALVGVIAGVFQRRRMRLGVFSDDHGLTIRNLFRTTRVARSEIESIAPRRLLPVPVLWTVRLCASGRRIDIDAVQEYGIFRAPRRIREIVERLEVERRRTEGANGLP